MLKKISNAWKLWSLHLYNFKGKTSRYNYNMLMIPLLIIGILLTAFLASLLFGKMGSTAINVISSIIFIIFEAVFFSGITYRRLEDIGANPWFSIIMFIPKVGFYFLIILMLVPSNWIINNKNDVDKNKTNDK